jgi:enterochelin esterase-like enzyme
MLEPQSTALFGLLIVIFGGLLWWMLVTRQAALRILAALLAFMPAMLFGVIAVNKYYGYYQTWGAAIADVTDQSISPALQVPGGGPESARQSGALNGRDMDVGLARQQGYTLRLTVTGQRSRITRVVYVYLPPQYFQARYRKYRFPAIELIHGQPGEPQAWINVVGVTYTLDRLLTEGLAQPVALVMPDANGSEQVSLQCLNQVGGPQDLTYLGVDLPQEIARILRVRQPGGAWGVAGYSEGGFCAANMALRLRHRYGFAGVLSGYFRPADNQLADPIRRVSPFGRSRGLRRQNTPADEIQKLPAGAVIPRFWLGAGAADKADVSSAEFFWQELQLRQADVPLTITPGGGHTMVTWRAQVPSMLRWMTQGLALADQRPPPCRPSGARDAIGQTVPSTAASSGQREISAGPGGDAPGAARPGCRHGRVRRRAPSRPARLARSGGWRHRP